MTVHDYAAPPRLAEQLGEPKALYVGGTRTRGAVSRADAVWLAFAAPRGAGDRWTAARWCRIDAVGGREARAQDQLVEDGAHHVFPNLVVDDAGNLLMIASRTASDEHPSLHYGRWPPSGPAEAGELVRGQGPHRRCRGGQSCDDKDSVNGWGDYNGIALDPDGATVWAIGGVGHTTDRQLWATAIVTL